MIDVFVFSLLGCGTHGAAGMVTLIRYDTVLLYDLKFGFTSWRVATTAIRHIHSADISRPLGHQVEPCFGCAIKSDSPSLLAKANANMLSNDLFDCVVIYPGHDPRTLLLLRD